LSLIYIKKRKLNILARLPVGSWGLAESREGQLDGSQEPPLGAVMEPVLVWQGIDRVRLTLWKMPRKGRERIFPVQVSSVVLGLPQVVGNIGEARLRLGKDRPHNLRLLL
jgi:hypothetical protein